MCNTSKYRSLGMPNPFLKFILTYKVILKAYVVYIQNGCHGSYDLEKNYTFEPTMMCNTYKYGFWGMRNPFLLLILTYKVNFKVKC